MRIIPVIDLMGGEIVHAVGGRRSEYRPIRSSLCASSVPIDVARGFRSHFGFEEIYLADLDAIAGRKQAASFIWTMLLMDGFRLWVDAGVRGLSQALDVAGGGAWALFSPGIVVGLETLAGPDALADIVSVVGEEVILSLDLRDGEPVGNLQGWKYPTAWGIAAEAVGLGVKRLLVLDLARVGEGAGTGTEELCAALAASYPHVEILAGGGVRDRADLLRLKACGVSAALVASALHDGRLTRTDLDGL